jgi:general secretion pathway protein M
MIKSEEFKHWWTHLQVREQWLLTAGGIFFILFLFYFILIQPINNALTSHIENIKAQKELLHWMQTAVPRLQTLRQSSTNRQTIAAGSLLSSVEQSLKQSQLSEAVSTLEKNSDQSDKESVQLKFDKIGFDTLMTWLISFWQTYNVNISQISVIRSKEPGMVQADLILNLPE